MKRQTSAANQNAQFYERCNDANRLGQLGLPIDDDEAADLAYENRHLRDDEWKALMTQMKADHYANPRRRRPGDPPPTERDRLCDKAMTVAFRYQRDPKRRHITYTHILKHLIANGGRLDEAALTGGRR